MKELYQLSPGELFDRFQTSVSGLTEETSAQRLKEFGENAVRMARPKSKLTILLSQFKDAMIAILLIAAIISSISGEQMDAVVILAIIVANAWIGYLQEYKAEEAIRMLQKMTPLFAIALRDQYPVKIAATALVTGDVILLEAGNIVPADARVIEADALTADESSLTGESRYVRKKAEALRPGGLVPGERHNMVFKGTIISSGSAKAVVTETGMQTEIGKIAGMLEKQSPKTPLQKRMAIFSRQLAAFVILICLAVFFMGLWRGEPVFVMFLTALSLAVAALPEALPAVIAIVLARGAGRMAQQNALVRTLPAVETLGSVTYICSDKTGTLTQNVMTVEKIYAVPGKEDLLMSAMLLNNDVRFSAGTLLGDSTEKALVDHAQKLGCSRIAAEVAFPLLKKIPFDSVRMRMGTFHQHKGRYILFVKGAPSKILAVLSPQYSNIQKNEWLTINHAWAADGMRVLFFCL